MNSLKDILSYIKKDDKPKSWEEIKTIQLMTERKGISETDEEKEEE